MYQTPPLYPSKSKTKLLYSFPVVLMLIILSFATMKGAVSSYKMHSSQNKKHDAALEDLSALSERQQKLIQENAWLKTERGQEQLFREQYMVAKSGENVMIVTSETSQLENTVTSETDNRSIFVKTRDALSGD